MFFSGTESCYRLFYMAQIAFWDRLKVAWRVLVSAEFAGEVTEGLELRASARAKKSAPPERVHASGLMLLAAFQREQSSQTDKLFRTGVHDHFK